MQPRPAKIGTIQRDSNPGAKYIERIELLGHKGDLAFTQTAEGLVVNLPEQKLSAIACSLKITGRDLRPPTTQK